MEAVGAEELPGNTALLGERGGRQGPVRELAAGEVPVVELQEGP